MLEASAGGMDRRNQIIRQNCFGDRPVSMHSGRGGARRGRMSGYYPNAVPRPANPASASCEPWVALMLTFSSVHSILSSVHPSVHPSIHPHMYAHALAHVHMSIRPFVTYLLAHLLPLFLRSFRPSFVPSFLTHLLTHLLTYLLTC